MNWSTRKATHARTCRASDVNADLSQTLDAAVLPLVRRAGVVLLADMCGFGDQRGARNIYSYALLVVPADAQHICDKLPIRRWDWLARVDVALREAR